MNVNAFNLLILIGAAHGVMMAGLLFFSRKNRRASNILLALLLAFYTLPVLRVILHDIGFFTSLGYSFLSVELLYGLGPSLYLYAKTASDPDYALRPRDLLHFAPVALELIYYLSPVYRQHGYYFFAAPIDARHLIWMIEQVGGIVSVLIYLALTNRLLFNYSKWVKRNYSDIHRRALSWLRQPVLLYTAFFVLWFGLRFLDVVRFDDSLSIEPYYPFLIFLSFSTYWIGTRGYLETRVAASGFSREDRAPSAEPLDDAMLSEAFARLETVMTRDRPYLENDLSLSQLAARLNVNPRLLSKVINARAKMNFYDFVNGYRVEEFKRRLGSSETNQPLLNLAHDCGFGSKATFNHVFKKSTGLTPSQYKKELDGDRAEGTEETGAARRGAE